MISPCLAALLPPSAACLQPVLGAFSWDKPCQELTKRCLPAASLLQHSGKASLAHATSYQTIGDIGLDGPKQQLPRVRPSLPSAHFPGNKGGCIRVISRLESPLPGTAPGSHRNVSCLGRGERKHCEECPC